MSWMWAENNAYPPGSWNSTSQGSCSVLSEKKTVVCKLLFWWFGSFSNFFSTIFPKFSKFVHLSSNRSPCFRCHRGGAGNRVLTSRISSHMFAHARSQPKLTSRKLRLFQHKFELFMIFFLTDLRNLHVLVCTKVLFFIPQWGLSL